MKKVNRKRAPKGTVTVRKKGNSYEARVTLELVSVIDGIEKNPRLSRTATSEKEARKRLGECIVDVYFEAQKQSINPATKVFSDECILELDNFSEYRKAKVERNSKKLANEYTLFTNIGNDWLNWKRDYINPANGKKISGKTYETYVSTFTNIKRNFKNYDIKDLVQDKSIVEKYINTVRVKTPRLAKDLFLMIRQILNYAKDEKNIITEVPDFNLKFPKRKRSAKTKIEYLTEERQKVWINTCEKDGRGFALLFATLIQTGMRPEEGCGLKWKSVQLDFNKLTVENAYKDITIYDENQRIIGHKYQDSDLKTSESYRTIPISKRLKSMLINLKENQKLKFEIVNKKWSENEYVFLNTQLGPFVAERLTKKITSFIKKYNLEHMTVYGFRHSFATLMSEKGMDKEVLRELMGHSDFETTDFYYIHVSEERKQKEFERIQSKTSSENTTNFQGKTQGKKYFLVRKRKIKKVLKLA